MVGRLTFREDGDVIDCSRMGVGGKAIPPNVDKVQRGRDLEAPPRDSLSCVRPVQPTSRLGGDEGPGALGRQPRPQCLDIKEPSLSPKTRQVTAIQSDAKFILLVEKDAAFMRLAEDRFYNTYPCIIITAKGQPDVATRWGSQVAVPGRLYDLELAVPVCFVALVPRVV